MVEIKCAFIFSFSACRVHKDCVLHCQRSFSFPFECLTSDSLFRPRSHGCVARLKWTRVSCCFVTIDQMLAMDRYESNSQKEEKKILLKVNKKSIYILYVLLWFSVP